MTIRENVNVPVKLPFKGREREARSLPTTAGAMQPTESLHLGNTEHRSGVHGKVRKAQWSGGSSGEHAEKRSRSAVRETECAPCAQNLESGTVIAKSSVTCLPQPKCIACTTLVPTTASHNTRGTSKFPSWLAAPSEIQGHLLQLSSQLPAGEHGAGDQFLRRRPERKERQRERRKERRPESPGGAFASRCFIGFGESAEKKKGWGFLLGKRGFGRLDIEG